MMRQIKIIIILILGLFGVIIGTAQNKSERLLDDVSRKINSFENMQITFEYILENYKEDIHQKMKGKIKVKKNKYNLSYMGVNKLYDGVKSYTIIPENEEVIVQSKPDDLSINPSKMLTFYKKGYQYKWDIYQNVLGNKIQYIELIPTVKTDNNIKKILLGINISNNMVYNVIQTDNNDVVTTITIKSLEPNQKMAGNIFSFDKDKYERMGYYIIEE